MYNSESSRTRNFKSASRFALGPSLSCTPLSPITISYFPVKDTNLGEAKHFFEPQSDTNLKHSQIKVKVSLNGKNWQSVFKIYTRCMQGNRNPYISNTRGQCFIPFPNTEKRVENSIRSETPIILLK